MSAAAHSLVSHDRPAATFLRAAAVVANDVGLGVDEIISPRGWPAKRARQTAIYLTVVACNVARMQVARVAGVRLWTVQSALARLEDARDDPGVDRRLTQLEEVMAA